MGDKRFVFPKQRWSREHNLRGQGQGLEKNPRPRPWTDFLRTDPLEANAKDQGHNFSKLWSANFSLFLSAKVFKIMQFVKFLIVIRK